MAMENSKQLMVRDVILLLKGELATAVMKIVRLWMGGIVLLIKRDSLRDASKFPQVDSVETGSFNPQKSATTVYGSELGVVAIVSHIQDGIAAEPYEAIRSATKYDSIKPFYIFLSQGIAISLQYILILSVLVYYK